MPCAVRRFFQSLLKEPVRKLADKYSSRPVKAEVHSSLSRLYRHIINSPGDKGPLITLDAASRYIIFSDLHKGAKNGADDFAFAEKNYLSALDHYFRENYSYINLGDSEELWENTLLAVKKHNKDSFEKEKLFVRGNRFIKIYGNHDLYWDNDPLAGLNLEDVYGQAVKIYAGAVLTTEIKNKKLNIFLTHGHQGDLQSDGNWFSKWFVSTIWAPLQSYLGINPNTPANDNTLKTDHNRLMYEWSARQENTVLITGHTHQPVFLSLTHLERMYRALDNAKHGSDTAETDRLGKEIALYHHRTDDLPDFSKYRPTYFNSGCCCYSDGDITGIEIDGLQIRLIKWEYGADGLPERIVLEEVSLTALTKLL